MKYLFYCSMLFCLNTLHAQDYSKWVTGNAEDVTTNHQQGIVLAGGGSDNDNAMKWMLQRADGGDVVVIRASGSNGYNNYFYSELGITVNSVETILFNSGNASNDLYVVQQIRNAEVLFIAGGDQYKYYQYWKDTPVEDAINYLINVKKATVGGTSAGMAILGNAYYTPSSSGITSAEALNNPLHPYMDIIGKDDFLDNPFLPDLITDTHYDNRGRAGRHTTFLARMMSEWGAPAYGIACNESTAVCIDENGIAKVFGEYPGYSDHAYFIQSTCQSPNAPETYRQNTPLTWNRNQKASTVYKLPGTTSGNNYFDLNDWKTGNGGAWQYWYVTDGDLNQVSGAAPAVTRPEISTQPVNATVCEGEETAFSIDADGNTLSYQWQLDDGSGFTNISDNSTYTGSGTSALKISNTGSSMNDFQYRCRISSGCFYAIYSEAVLLTVDVCSYLQEQQSRIKCYFDPASQHLILGSPGFSDDAYISVYNAFGQVIVFHSSILPDKHLLDLSETENGVYFCKVQTESETHIYKFIK